MVPVPVPVPAGFYQFGSGSGRIFYLVPVDHWSWLWKPISQYTRNIILIFLSSISVAAVPTIVDSTGDEVINHYFTDDADLTLTCKITAADGEYTLAWFDDGMYNVM